MSASPVCNGKYSADNPPTTCKNKTSATAFKQSLDLDPWKLDFKNKDAVGFTETDYNNAMLYAKKRLCLEMGFYWNPISKRAEYTPQQCNVAAVANGECMGSEANPGLHDPLGTLSLKCSKRSKLSPAYWIYANQEPQAAAYCAAAQDKARCTASAFCAWDGSTCKKATVQTRMPLSMFPYSAYNADVKESMFEDSAGAAMEMVGAAAGLAFISPLGALAGSVAAGIGDIGSGASGGATDIPIKATTEKNCEELGGSWDSPTDTCKVTPYPTVAHQCVYGMGWGKTGSAAQTTDEETCTGADGVWRDGECVVAMRLRIEVDSCTPATGAFCLFALFLIALLTVYAYGVADHFTDQLEW